MRSFRDENHVSNTPKMWTAPNGRRLDWRSDKQPFQQFYDVVVEYHQANQLAVPSREEVVDAMCRQMPRWACVDPGFHGTTVNRAEPYVVSRTGGCKSCGGKR